MECPRYIQFFPTLRCNGSCSFCFMRGAPALPDIEYGDFKIMLDALVNHGVPSIDVLGGEPALHPRLSDMLKATSSAGLKCTLSTNGSRVPVIERLSGLFPKKTLRIGVSLNRFPVPEELHNYILRHRPMLKTVYQAGTGAPRMLGAYGGMRGISLYLLYRDAIHPEDVAGCGSFPLYGYALSSLRKTYKGLEGVSCGFMPGPGEESGHKTRCPAGTTKISVMPDGSVYPCYLLYGYKEFLLGNILSDGLTRILLGPALGFFREKAGNPCRNAECVYYSSCRGGCPGVSLRVLGDINLPDPRCGGVIQGVRRIF